MEEILAFTGHRPHKLGNDYNYTSELCENIKLDINMQLRRIKPAKCILGGALGIDEIALVECLKMNIPCIVALPFKDWDSKWPEHTRKRYRELLNHPLVTIKIICEGPYHPDKMQIRNEWMVDNSTILSAVWNGDINGGTWNCIKYAIQKKAKIDYINI